MKTYYLYAEKLIKKGLAYVCTCKNFKFYADNRVECPCRKLDDKENLKRWKIMFKEKEGYGVIRNKTDILQPKPDITDWPSYSINKKKHTTQSKKNKVKQKEISINHPNSKKNTCPFIPSTAPQALRERKNDPFYYYLQD